MEEAKKIGPYFYLLFEPLKQETWLLAANWLSKINLTATDSAMKI
jgi:hypothetical protein